MARDLLAPLEGTSWGRDTAALTPALDRLRSGPEPEAVAARVGRLLRAVPSLADRSPADPALAERLVALCASGRALVDVAVSLGDAAAQALATEAIAPPVMALDPADPAGSLRRVVRRHLLAVAALDLTGVLDMPAVGRALATLADAAAGAALAACPSPARLCVIALGKWGGCELNYASDIDLVLVHEGDAAAALERAARFVDLLGRRGDDGVAYRVDLDLRPEGAAGPLTRSLDSYRAYWERWALNWERQALLKARVAAGDPALGTAFLEAAHGFVHPEVLGAEAVREIRAMKGRTESLVNGTDEVKRGVGGIRDVEFAVQLLQLVHGRADPDLRSANTLEALARLEAGGYLRPEDTRDLSGAYRWLRTVEHRIQLHDLRQTHALPTDPVGRTRLAKVMGYRDDPAQSALERFEADLRACRTTVRGIHERLFYRPLLEAFAAATPTPRHERQLAALGFTDSAAARAAVADLTAGLSRRSRLMQQLLPLMMEWLAGSPDPDLGLAQLRLLVTAAADNESLVGALRDDPAAAERLCRLLGTARAAGRLIDRIPQALPTLGHDASLEPPQAATLVAGALARVAVRGTHAARLAALHRFWGEHLFATVSADVAGLADVVAVGRRLSDAADALAAGVLAAALDQARDEGRDPPPMTLVALGKWGGAELTYASDLDGLLVFAASGRPGEEADAARVAELVTAAPAASAGLPPPALDLDLRPEGKRGVIARSLASYESYWERWALTWEHQALLRCRPAAGEAALGAAFVAAAHRYAYPERLDEERVRQIRAMKARVEQERIPLGEDPDFHVKLGRGALADVEWVVQLLQMRHGHDAPAVHTPSTLAALAALHRLGVVGAQDAAILDAAYRFCAGVRNRLFLRAGRTRDSLPTDPAEAAAVGRSLGYAAAPRTALREEYRRVTRRARAVFTRLFYGG